MTTLPTPEQIAAFTDRARALEAWDARLSLLADHDRFREHSITLNSVSWKLSEALGDVPPGTDSIVSAGGLVNAERIIAELATAKAEVARLTALITAPDGSGIPEPLLLAMLAMANHAEGLDVADHELLDHHRTETYRTVAESVWSAARERVEELRTELAETRGVAAMNWDASAYHHGEWVKASAQRDEAWAWLPYEMRCTLTAKWAEQAAAVPAAPAPAHTDELTPELSVVSTAELVAMRAIVDGGIRNRDVTVELDDAAAAAVGVETEQGEPVVCICTVTPHQYGEDLVLHLDADADCPAHGGHTAAPVVAEATQAEPVALRRRWQDNAGVTWTEHPTGCLVMEVDPDSYDRLIDTMDSPEELDSLHGPLVELRPARAYDAAPDAVPAAADLPCDGTCLRDDQTKPCGSCEAAADEAASEAAADRDGA